MSTKINPKQSLISTQLNNIMLNILCQTLLKQDGFLVENQKEIQTKDFNLNTELDGFDSKLIINYFSEKDSFNRICFNMKLLTYNSKNVAHLEMIFNQNNEYEEGSFLIFKDELVTESLLQFLKNNYNTIVENIF